MHARTKIAVAVTAMSIAAASGGISPAGAIVLGQATPALAAGWSIESTPVLTGATSSALAGVACETATSCVAVGSYVNSSGVEVTLAEAWNGTSWSIQPTPNPAGATTSALSGVGCSTIIACTAVGYYVNGSGVDLTLKERWNGADWTIQPSANPAGGGVFSGVSCTAISCIGVGNGSQNAPLAEGWNGSTWVIQPTATPVAGGVLSGVSCTAASACSAVGRSGTATLAEAWNGTTWSIQPTPNPAPLDTVQLSSLLSGVSCAGATGCTAVGYWIGWKCNNGKPFCNCLELPYCTHRRATLVEAWDGATWAIQPSPSPGYAGLLGVSCVSASVCTAVGTYSGLVIGEALAEQWNGSTWTYQYPPTPSTGATLTGVSCTAGAACTAVGRTNASGGTTLVERYSG